MIEREVYRNLSLVWNDPVLDILRTLLVSISEMTYIYVEEEKKNKGNGWFLTIREILDINGRGGVYNGFVPTRGYIIYPDVTTQTDIEQFSG